ncbi:hypothetical protein [Planotetraspora kaengkrachanensis]|uniref:Uncharacterized protein n=1 Tax=Planotetraspora kaengkrachanensis TaxID=575193 RepID=A0A8J3M0D2_9ACTN|nr:hypothetical protein [Planotetraspora kaengkrachanensis]GIG80045.1 hypothetical protein Pka01_31720 [Planotetraspora kaengkrachanensis]
MVLHSCSTGNTLCDHMCHLMAGSANIIRASGRQPVQMRLDTAPVLREDALPLIPEIEPHRRLAAFPDQWNLTIDDRGV